MPLAPPLLQVCATLAQCGELFLQLPGVSATPLLVRALEAEDGASVDLLFDAAGKEAEAWKVGVAHLSRGRAGRAPDELSWSSMAAWGAAGAGVSPENALSGLPQANVEGVRGRLAELSAAGLALECSQWLDQLSAALHALGGRLLGPCASGQGLLSVEAAVKAALEDWQYTLQATRWAGVPAGWLHGCESRLLLLAF